MAHTPGPWETNKHKSLGDKGVFIIQQRAGDFFSIAEIFTNNNEANAHLIAAAPDLLAACEAVVTYLAQSSGFDSLPPEEQLQAEMSLSQKLHTAIKKAKGE